MAPEMLNSNYGIECDYWSLGVILYYLLSKQLPFDDQNELKSLYNLS